MLRWPRECGERRRGRSTGDELVEAFVEALAVSGRSSYTQRFYALGGVFFAFLVESGAEGWRERSSPVPAAVSAVAGGHGMPGRDASRRGRRTDLRQRVPRRLPRRVEPEVARRLIDIAAAAALDAAGGGVLDAERRR